MLKKLTSLITLVFMLASLVSIGAYADDAVITNLDIYNDFSGINLSNYYNADGSIKEGDTAKTASNIAQAGHPSMYLQNPDFSLKNEENFVTGTSGAKLVGTGIASKGTDAKYGTTLVLTKSETFARAGFSLDNRSSFGTTGTNVIEFAIKRDQIAGSDIFVRAMGNTSSGGAFSDNDGIDFVKFTKDGKILVNGSKKGGSYHATKLDSFTALEHTGLLPVGNYEAGVWYEVKIEYVPDDSYYVDDENKNYNGLSVITINGGEYNNKVVYTAKVHGNPIFRLNFRFENYTSGQKADMHLGYLKTYDSSVAKTIDDISEYENKLVDYSDYNVGTYKSNAYRNHDNSASLKYFRDGFVYNINGNTDESAQIVNIGGTHGNVLKFGKVVANHHQLKYMFEAPYSKPYLSKVVGMEFDLYLTSDVDLRFLIGTNSGYFLTDTVSDTAFKGGNQLKKDTWLKAIMTLDVPNKGYSLTIYDENDMAKFYRNGSLTQADLGKFDNIKAIGIYPKPKTDDAYIYLDNFKIYTQSTQSFSKLDNVTDGVTTDLDKAVTAFFNAPVNEANVTLKCDGTPVSAKVITAGNFVNVIPSQGYFEGEKNYTLEIKNAKNIFGNTIDKDISFTTGKNTTITYRLVNSAGDPIDNLQKGAKFQLNLTSNNGKVIPMKAALCVFDNATNELLNIYSWFYTQDSNMRTQYDWTALPVNVTDFDKQHLRLFIWDENNVPMVEEDIIYTK